MVRPVHKKWESLTWATHQTLGLKSKERRKAALTTHHFRSPSGSPEWKAFALCVAFLDGIAWCVCQILTPQNDWFSPHERCPRPKKPLENRLLIILVAFGNCMFSPGNETSNNMVKLHTPPSSPDVHLRHVTEVCVKATLPGIMEVENDSA